MTDVLHHDVDYVLGHEEDDLRGSTLRTGERLKRLPSGEWVRERPARAARQSHPARSVPAEPDTPDAPDTPDEAVVWSDTPSPTPPPLRMLSPDDDPDEVHAAFEDALTRLKAAGPTTPVISLRRLVAYAAIACAPFAVLIYVTLVLLPAEWMAPLGVRTGPPVAPASATPPTVTLESTPTVVISVWEGQPASTATPVPPRSDNPRDPLTRLTVVCINDVRSFDNAQQVRAYLEQRGPAWRDQCAAQPGQDAEWQREWFAAHPGPAVTQAVASLRDASDRAVAVFQCNESGKTGNGQWAFGVASFRSGEAVQTGSTIRTRNERGQWETLTGCRLSYVMP